jgi:hypothetical protein
MVSVVGIVPDVMNFNVHNALSDRPLQHAVAEWTDKHLREEGKNINTHSTKFKGQFLK